MNAFLFINKSLVGSSNGNNARLNLFKKFCPRREIDVLWGILAFFAKGRFDATASDLRWRLTASLFSYQTGVLGQIVTGASAKHTLPPNDVQLKHCAEELHNFATLLGSGSMDPLPGDNGILAKLLYRSVTLHSQRHRKHITSKISTFLTVPSRKDSKLAFKVWQESDISHLILGSTPLKEPLSRRLLNELVDLDGPGESQFTLTSSSEVLNNTLLLLKEWSARMPNKKARWSRLGDTLSSFVNKLLKDAADMASTEGTRAPSSDIDDAFAKFFSNNVSSYNDDSEGSLSGASLCEAAVLVVTIVLQGRAKFQAERDHNFPLQFDSHFCEKVR